MPGESDPRDQPPRQLPARGGRAARRRTHARLPRLQALAGRAVPTRLRGVSCARHGSSSATGSADPTHLVGLMAPTPNIDAHAHTVPVAMACCAPAMVRVPCTRRMYTPARSTPAHSHVPRTVSLGSMSAPHPQVPHTRCAYLLTRIWHAHLRILCFVGCARRSLLVRLSCPACVVGRTPGARAVHGIPRKIHCHRRALESRVAPCHHALLRPGARSFSGHVAL